MTTTNPHISEHPIGQALELTWKRTNRQHYVAKLARRHFHNEEWRVYAVNEFGRESYLMSEGWKWVSDNVAS